MFKNIQYKEINIVKKDKKKSINYGLAILKAILAYLVVVHHCFHQQTTKNKFILEFTKERFLHVPSFFILSFYFMSKNLLSLNPKIILNRFLRLLIPYIGWALIILKINHLFNNKFHQKLKDSYSDLKIQLLWGTSYIGQFWFLTDLMIMTLMFILIIFIFRKHSLYALQLLLILSYINQYNKNIYKKYFLKCPKYNKRTISYFFVSITFAVTGYTLGYYKVLDILQKYKIKTLILSVIIYNIVVDYNIFTDTRFMPYQGIDLNIQCICIIFIFSLFPSDKIKNKYFLKFLIIITNYTAGVFYLHLSIKRYLNIFFKSIKNYTFTGVIIIYIFCYLICLVGMMILGKTPLKYLFC